jgi:hypothetical protein
MMVDMGNLLSNFVYCTGKIYQIHLFFFFLQCEKTGGIRVSPEAVFAFLASYTGISMRLGSN